MQGTGQAGVDSDGQLLNCLPILGPLWWELKVP